jgi:hypothetical protein
MKASIRHYSFGVISGLIITVVLVCGPIIGTRSGWGTPYIPQFAICKTAAQEQRLFRSIGENCIWLTFDCYNAVGERIPREALYDTIPVGEVVWVELEWHRGTRIWWRVIDPENLGELEQE